MTSDGARAAVRPPTETHYTVSLEHGRAVLRDGRPEAQTPAPASVTPFSASVRAAAAPFARAERAPLTAALVTCAICGGRDATTTIAEDEDGHPLRRPEPACAICAAEVATPTAALAFHVKRERQRRLEGRLLVAISERPGATLRRLCVDLDLHGEDAQADDETRNTWRMVRHAIAALVKRRSVRRHGRDTVQQFTLVGVNLPPRPRLLRPTTAGRAPAFNPYPHRRDGSISTDSLHAHLDALAPDGVPPMDSGSLTTEDRGGRRLRRKLRR